MGEAPMLSLPISRFIVRYILTENGYSHKELAEIMGLTLDDIDKIVDGKKILPKDSLETFLKISNTRFWELAYKAVPKKHFPPKTWEKIILCKTLAKSMKKRK